MNDNDEEKPQDKGPKKKTHDGGAADLEKVTDYEEERVVVSSHIAGVSFILLCIYGYEHSIICFIFLKAIDLIDSRRTKEAELRQAKERELAKVSIKKEDVEVLVM